MEIEPLDKKTIAMIARTLGNIPAMICNLHEADVSRGCAQIGPREKCLWTKDGKRISIATTVDGGLIASCSKEPDPEAPEGKQ